MKEGPLANVLLYATVVVLWGTSWLAIRFQLGIVAPEVSVAYRFYIAASVMIAFCLLSGRRLGFPLREHASLALLGMLLFSTNFILMYLGGQYMATGLLSVVFSMLSIFNIANAAWMMGARVRPRVLVGALLGVCGIVLIFSPEVTAFRFGDAGIKGFIFAIGGTISASLGMVFSAKRAMAGRPLVQSNAWGMAYGALFMTLFALIAGKEFTFDPSWGYILSLGHLSIMATVIAFAAYLTLQVRIGSDRAAYASVMFPIIALTLSTLFEGYHWTTPALLGVVIVLWGNTLVLSRPGTFSALVRGRRAPQLENPGGTDT
ncbi:MAG: EamA family transporter [Rhodospirillales bacterium]|nr:EamA family transporter [Rhodospirillales bacterium]